jgi:hypothetical protein
MKRHSRSPGVDLHPWPPELFWVTGRRLIGFDEPLGTPPINLQLLDEAIEQLYGRRCRACPRSASVEPRRSG